MCLAFHKDMVKPLDGLRLAAVVLVFWAHLPYTMFGVIGNKLVGYLLVGTMGVDIFFVLSGFLITRILLCEKARGLSLKNFYIRRALRIFPIYYLLLAVLAIAGPGPSNPGLPWAATYLYNFYASFVYLPADPLGHLWSLAVEEHFYLLWPWMVALMTAAACRRVTIWVLMPLAVAAALTTNVLWVAYEGDPLHLARFTTRCTGFRMLSLLAGAVMAFHEDAIRRHAGRAAGIALGLVAAAVALRLLLPVGSAREYVPFREFIACSFGSSGIVLAVLALKDSWAMRPLTWGPVLYGGRISYGLYLYHLPIFLAFGIDMETPMNPSMFWRVPAAIATTFGVAGVSFQLLERPLLRLKDRWASKG